MLTFVGAICLIHAAYSSYEHHQVLSSAVPRDIVLEVVVGLVLINFGAIKANAARMSLTSSDRVAPPSRFLQPIDTSKAAEAMKALGYSEHEVLETRVDFVDVRQKREEHLKFKGA